MAVVIVAGMRRSEASPLKRLLQRAWLQSHRPKVQRRITSAPLADVPLGRRDGSQSSSVVLSEKIPARAGYQDGPEISFFHKTRLDASTVFISRFALPELKVIQRRQTFRDQFCCCNGHSQDQALAMAFHNH